MSEFVYLSLLTVFVSLLGLTLLYLKRSFDYWKHRNVQAAPVIFPFGNAIGFVFQKTGLGDCIKDVYFKMKSKGLKLCGFFMLTKPILIPIDLDLIKTIMSKDFSYFTDRPMYLNEKDDPLSGHLAALKGEKWKKIRSMITPALSSGQLKLMFQSFLKCSDELMNLMDATVKGGGPVDVKGVVEKFTLDVLASCAIGIECNSLIDHNSKFKEYEKKASKRGVVESFKMRFLSTFFPGVLKFFRMSLTSVDITKFFINLTKEVVRYRKENNVVRKDVVQMLMQNMKCNKVQESDEGRTLTIEEVAAQVFVIYLAGSEPSALTLILSLYELSCNPEVQERLRDEITDVLEKHGGKVTYDAVMAMVYMDKCISETLRKYPPVTLLTRECTRTYKFPDSDLVLEEGTIVIIPVTAIHYDPEYYPDPERFDPERFSLENKSKRHSYAFLGFGNGPRICYGMRFGLQQIKVALSVLLKKYKFSVNSRTRMPLVVDPRDFIVFLKSTVWLNVEKVMEEEQ